MNAHPTLCFRGIAQPNIQPLIRDRLSSLIPFDARPLRLANRKVIVCGGTRDGRTIGSSRERFHPMAALISTASALTKPESYVRVGCGTSADVGLDSVGPAPGILSLAVFAPALPLERRPVVAARQAPSR